jgi:hypothetical protein
MKRIKSLLFLILLGLLMQACKKDKAEAPPPDPIAVYNFDNNKADNNVSHLLQGSIHGLVLSTSDSLGTTKSAFKFNGGSYVKVDDSDLLDFAANQFTIAVWIKPSLADLQDLVWKNGDQISHSPWSLDIHPGVVRASVRTNTKEQFVIEGQSPVKPLVWQHIAMTFTGEQLTVYYDGKSEGNVSIDRPLAINTGVLFIGAVNKSFPSMEFVVMDNLRIYDEPLTAGQVMNLYKNYK